MYNCRNIWRDYFSSIELTNLRKEYCPQDCHHNPNMAQQSLLFHEDEIDEWTMDPTLMEDLLSHLWPWQVRKEAEVQELVRGQLGQPRSSQV